MDFKKKRVTALGLGKSGLETALLLYKLGSKVRVSDCQDNETLRTNANILTNKKIEVELGRHSIDFICDSDVVVASPGIKSDSLILKSIKEKGIPLIGEIELGFLLCPATIIAITGTNGKTTVTTLVGEVLKETGKKVFVCGNIGNPFSKYVLEMDKDDLVSLEVSSFQLETIVKFKPKIAVLLNISCNHLDRHADMQEYLDMKKRIFMNQDSSDYALLNHAYPQIRDIANSIKSKIIFFNQKENQDELTGNPNFLAAEAVGSIFGVEKERSREIFEKFPGIEHRLEYVRTINGVDFINDSKATTVDATIWALNALDKPLILIAGGRDKGADFSLIKDLVKSRVKEVILIGEARDKIGKAINNAVPIKESDTLEEAVSAAHKASEDGDCVLLSPMCASFDMFANFEERGRVFKDIVSQL